MDRIKLRAYQGLLKSGRITKETVYNNVLSNKITTEDYKFITGEDCPELPLDVIKANKINEIKKLCNEEILAGFLSSAKGTEELYDFEYENQINIEALKNNVALGLVADGTLTYYRKGGNCEIWTNSEFLQLYNDAMTFKTERIVKCKAIIELISNVGTIEDLDVILWDMEIQ